MLPPFPLVKRSRILPIIPIENDTWPQERLHEIQKLDSRTVYVHIDIHKNQIRSIFQLLLQLCRQRFIEETVDEFYTRIVFHPDRSQSCKNNIFCGGIPALRMSLGRPFPLGLSGQTLPGIKAYKMRGWMIFPYLLGLPCKRTSRIDTELQTGTALRKNRMRNCERILEYSDHVGESYPEFPVEKTLSSGTLCRCQNACACWWSAGPDTSVVPSPMFSKKGRSISLSMMRSCTSITT